MRKCKVGRCDVQGESEAYAAVWLALTAATIVLGVVPQLIALTMSFYSVKGDYAAGNPSGWMMGNYFGAANFAVLVTFV